MTGPAAAGTVYLVEIEGRPTTVTVTADGVSIDGQLIPATIDTVSDSPIRLLRLGDAVFELVPRRGERKGSYTIVLPAAGARVGVEALDERSRAVRTLRAATALATGPEPVRAPMPGLVTRVLVSVGDAVRPGDGLIVMEAMKMENELRAKSAGRVRSLPVAPGTAVEKGALLVELASD